METIIEIFRVILKAYRKHNIQIGDTFRNPVFQISHDYRFIFTNELYLQTPYAKFKLFTSEKMNNELIERLGEVITHVNGKPVQMTYRWDKQRFNEELKQHLSLIYDPEDVLFRVSLNQDFYIKAKNHYVNSLALHNKSIMTDYIQLVGLSVQLYNKI